jgi:hypothetical protein
MKVSDDFEPWSGCWGSFFARRNRFEVGLGARGVGRLLRSAL